MTSPLYSSRLVEALGYAAVLHGTQARKSTHIPYLSHLLAVCALVLEDGGTEDEAIAALLHDAVEDQGGEAALREISRRYGDRVAGLVLGCSDSTVSPKPPWRQRKERALASFEQADPSILLIAAADKLHNVSATLTDLDLQGSSVWERFKTGVDGFMWYHSEFLAIAERRIPHSRSVHRLRSAMNQLISKMEGKDGAPPR